MKVLGWVLAFAVFWVFADATSGKNTIGVTASNPIVGEIHWSCCAPAPMDKETSE